MRRCAGTSALQGNNAPRAGSPARRGAQRPQDLLNACIAEHCGRLGLAQVDTPLFHRVWPDLQPLCSAEDLLQPDVAHHKDAGILFDPALQQGELYQEQEIYSYRKGGVAISTGGNSYIGTGGNSYIGTGGNSYCPPIAMSTGGGNSYIGTG